MHSWLSVVGGLVGWLVATLGNSNVTQAFGNAEVTKTKMSPKHNRHQMGINYNDDDNDDDDDNDYDDEGVLFQKPIFFVRG